MATERRTPDDTLVVLIEKSPTSYDPRFATSSYDVKLSALVAPGLTTIDTDDLEPKMLLAQSMERVDDLTWQVQLRSDLRFSDGRSVTSRDVAFTFSSVADKDLGSIYRGAFVERFERVEIVDNITVRFHLVKPIATFASDLTFGIISEEAALDGKVVGAGWYEVEDFSEGDIVLVRNRYCVLGGPALSRVRLRAVADENARNLMLVGGSADLAQNLIRADLVRFMGERPRLVVQNGPSNILSYLMMQNQDPILGDVRVRQAIAHAVDREAIVATKFGGRAVVATGLLPPMHWAYQADVPRYDFDLEKARDLLDQAGFADPDGPGGDPRFVLSYKTSNSPFRIAVANSIVESLKQVDIAVELRAYEFHTVFGDIKKGNFQLASMQTAPISEPDYYFTYFHSSRIPTPDNPGVHNRWRFADAEVDELTERARVTADKDERKRLYGRVQEIVARELPIVPLWHEDNVVIANSDVQGFALHPTASFSGLVAASKRARTGHRWSP